MPLCASLQDPLQSPLPPTEALQSYTSYIWHQPVLLPLGKNTFMFVRMKFQCLIFSPLEFWKFDDRNNTVIASHLSDFIQELEKQVTYTVI